MGADPEERGGRLCPRCKAREDDETVRTCRVCGVELVEIIRAEVVGGHRQEEAGETVRSPACDAPLAGPPLSECFPRAPFEPRIQPVVVLGGASQEVRRVALASIEIECGDADLLPRISNLVLTADGAQMSGPPKDHVPLGVGESVEVFARGLDDKGNWFPLPESFPVRWSADRELELSSGAGHRVTIRLLREPKVSALVTARARGSDGRRLQRIFTVERKPPG
ncbi:MAG: hypothetical protein QW379_07470 [Thermoplasmata archaeon]